MEDKFSDHNMTTNHTGPECMEVKSLIDWQFRWAGCRMHNTTLELLVVPKESGMMMNCCNGSVNIILQRIGLFYDAQNVSW